MDGVLADFDGAVLQSLPSPIERVARTNFYIARDYPQHLAEVKAVYSHPDFFYNLSPVAGAVEGWQRLLEFGYTPRVCTAPLTLNPKSVDGKISWLQKYLVPHFGTGIVDQAIIDKRKFDYDAFALIDDRPDVDTNGGKASWQHIVFDQPYNQAALSQRRMFGWADPNLESTLASVVRHQR